MVVMGMCHLAGSGAIWLETGEALNYIRTEERTGSQAGVGALDATGSSPVTVKKRKSTIPLRLCDFADDQVATGDRVKSEE